MFTKTNKLLIVLGLFSLPLAVGCEVNGGDDDAAGTGTDTDPGTDTGPGTDDTNGDDTTSAGPGTDTSAGTDTGAETGTDTGGSDTAGDSTGGGGAGICLPGCAEAADCCEAFELPAEQCDNGYGTWECNAESYCSIILCADDQECVDFGLGLDTCGDDGVCFEACAEDADCENMAAGATCVEGECAFEAPPGCEDDSDCAAPFGICDTRTGACIECVEDADCESSSNGQLCQDTGICGCDGDRTCNIDGDVCAIE